MFKDIPAFGEVTEAAIGNGLTGVVPLTLQTNNSATYPQTEIKVLNWLKSELSNIYTNSSFNQQENLASVIIAWNVLQHFFPYFDVIDTNWEEVLKKTLINTLKNKSKKDFFFTLSEMIAQLEDGHGIVFSEEMYYLPIRTEFIENKIVITASTDTALTRGDIIHKIDGEPVIQALEEKEKIISGSPQLRRYRALNVLGSKFDQGKAEDKYIFEFAETDRKTKPNSRETLLLIERNGKEENVKVSNSRNGHMFFNPINERKYLSETIIEIESGIYYINMANCTVKEFEQKVNILAHAKAVIYDQREGNKLSFFQIIPYLIEKPVISTCWNTPQTIYPERKKVEFHKFNWDIQPKLPLFKSKSIIINVPSVLSSGETLIGIIEHYNLATTVGEPTGGCNGNKNTIKMPCGYNVWFTGMKVLKHDDSQLYKKGFEPHYPVKKTIQGIKEGIDEFLEKALEVAKSK